MITIPPQIIAAAQASQKKWGIPASISIGQWAYESGWGAKDLGCFNYFGMKAATDARGAPVVPFVTCRTREVDKAGKAYYVNAPFRKFASAEEAFDEHGKLLATKGAYANARRKLPDPNAFADALTGVYATDPTYGTTLKSIIRTNNLTRYDHA